MPEKSWLNKLGACACILYTFMFSLFISLVKGQLDVFKIKKKAIQNGIQFILSDEFKELPLIQKNINKNEK